MRENRFHVVLLRSGELLENHCTLREAAAFLVGYQQSIDSAECGAAIVLADTRTVIPALQSSRQSAQRTHRFEVINAA